MGRTFIYSRISTSDQTNTNQTIHLKKLYPEATVIEEVASGVKARPELDRLVNELRSGDTLVVAALDRLGRRTSQILNLIESLQQRGIVLKSVREGIDYSTIMGKLVTQILCSISELERNVLSERTKLALAARRQIGIIGGRRRKFSAEQIQQAQEMRNNGKTLLEISVIMKISIPRLSQLTKPLKCPHV